MENLENKFLKVENRLGSIRGIFDKNQISIQLQSLEKKTFREKFWKISH